MTPPHDQHAVSAIAIIAPAASLWAHAPEVITIVVGVMGIMWYGIIITEKVLHFVHRWRRNHPKE